MPNHLINKIVWCSDFSKFEKYISKKDKAEFLDFDKIVPMPKELAKSGSDGEMGEILRLGQAYIDNKSKYGFPTWYEWRNHNWGTNWPCYENKIKRNKEGKIVYIEFQTAWDVPEPIFEKLAKECDFAILYADEDIGSNIGVGRANNGVFISRMLPVKFLPAECRKKEVKRMDKKGVKLN